MKLCFVIKSLYCIAGGAERVICEISSEMCARGHDVVLVTCDHPGQDPFFNLDHRVQRINLGLGDPGAFSNLWVTLSRMKALRQIVMENRPDVVIGFMHSIFVPLGFSLIGTQVPLIGSEHTVPEYYRKRPLEKILLVLVAPFVSRVTVLSESIKKRYPTILQRKMIAISNPLRAARTQSRDENENDRFTLLSIGRLDEGKNHQALIRAFAKIASEFPMWDLEIIGEGILRPNLELLVESLNIGSRVRMPGAIRLIESAYQNADLFVIPSHYEAFGLVTAEAMTYGLPVVGFSDCPGTNELIESGKTGILVDQGHDPEGSLADALRMLLENPDLRRKLGSAARESIEGRFSIEHASDQWEKLFVRTVFMKRSLSVDQLKGGR
ncbi:glycosyltransferase family 4 protein [Mesorhizobium japonicum]|uniref:glycosyltransferase family 4 protein n=1 Tax=Mesorhizobium japonicum TaxID=2066070 RepID=UPI003B5C020F